MSTPDRVHLRQFFTTDINSAAELDLVVQAFDFTTFKRGDYLFSAGQVINHYYILEAGFVRSFAIDTGGNDITTNFFSASQIVIDWPAFFMHQTSEEYYQAMSDCRAWKISYDRFQQLFNTHADFRESGRFRLVGSYFAMKKRHINMITKSAKERYEMLMKQHPDIIQNASLKHIATFLGITDSSLSRIRKEISDERFLS